MNCDCSYCYRGEEHPVTHTHFKYYENEKRSFEICYDCGHIRAELEK